MTELIAVLLGLIVVMLPFIILSIRLTRTPKRSVDFDRPIPPTKNVVPFRRIKK